MNTFFQGNEAIPPIYLMYKSAYMTLQKSKILGVGISVVVGKVENEDRLNSKGVAERDPGCSKVCSPSDRYTVYEFNIVNIHPTVPS